MELLRSEAVFFLADRVLTVVVLKSTIFLALSVGVLSLFRGGRVTARAATGAVAGLGLLVLAAAVWGRPLAQAGLVTFPTEFFEDGFAGRLFGVPAPATGGSAGAAPDAGLLRALSALPGASWLATVWLVGFVLVVVRFVIGRLRVERIARRASSAADPVVVRTAGRIARDLGIGRAVTLRQARDVALPVMFGIMRPVILLPADARAWTEDRLASVLYHELAHVRRHDYAVLIALEIVVALYWVNPLVWLFAREVRRTQDLACDAVVLRSGVRSTDYARHLLHTARLLRARRRLAGALPFSCHSGLRRRIDAVLDGHVGRAEPSRRAALAAVGLVLLAVAGLLAATDLWDCDATAAAVARNARITTSAPT